MSVIKMFKVTNNKFYLITPMAAPAFCVWAGQNIFMGGTLFVILAN